MLIPAIDLQDGRIVQLIQGERLALAFDNLDAWIERFADFPLVQVIDLDAAKGLGSNTSQVRRLCKALPCRVGGGIKGADAGEALLADGAREVIYGSALFRDGRVDEVAADAISKRLGPDHVVAAVDSRNGRIVRRGWTETTTITPEEALRALEPYVGGFLYTIVEGEGLMRGIDIDAVQRARQSTTRRLTAAGGICDQREIDLLHAIGVDAVVGMAVYTGRIALSDRDRRTP
jgi:phosphoribosylformimino-5-aminoimidazole carboxamide ribotide isomerase